MLALGCRRRSGCSRRRGGDPAKEASPVAQLSVVSPPARGMHTQYRRYDRSTAQTRVEQTGVTGLQAECVLSLGFIRQEVAHRSQESGAPWYRACFSCLSFARRQVTVKER